MNEHDSSGTSHATGNTRILARLLIAGLVAWLVGSLAGAPPRPASAAPGENDLAAQVAAGVPGTEFDLADAMEPAAEADSGMSPTVPGTFGMTADPPPPPARHILLAWAGQRVILEHDWRLPPGDTTGVTPNGVCPFLGSFDVAYVRGAGPGNFLPGLDVAFNSLDEVVATVSGSDTQSPAQVPSQPQGACISRVLYESEDAGQADIEALPVGADPSGPKAAFVIWYMKFNTVTLATEAGLAKPSVNATNGDFAPGNPWLATAPAGAVTRGVASDALVRGTIKGWFVNENPSGRPQDDTDPLNVLPANRWVLPDDWAVLAGGPPDPADGSDATGTAETFRASLDIMVAPNNSSGLTCATPSGPCNEQPIGAPSVSALPGIIEGPFSTLDLAGPGSAALAATTFDIRESILRDGDIDRWDAPMPPAMVAVDIRGTGYIRQVRKQDVYYAGSPDQPGQTFTNQFYFWSIPTSPFVPAFVAGGSYLWNTWGNDGPGGTGDGPYQGWVPALVGVNADGEGDISLTPADQTELAGLRTANGDASIARTLVVYTDNHGEFMVAANGRFRAEPGTCTATTGAGAGTITAVADYPDFRGKHPYVTSNTVAINWARPLQLVNAVAPNTMVIGTPAGAFTVTGSGFVEGESQICVNGAAVPTTFLSATELTGVIPGSQVVPGTYEVRVVSTAPGGPLSSSLVILATVQDVDVEAADAGTSDDPTETVSVAADGGASGSAQATTSPGTGTVAVAVYAENPGTATTFAAEAYFDIFVAPASTFASVTAQLCQSPGGPDTLYWFDGTAPWLEVSDYTYDSGTGCFTVFLTDDSSPSLADLSGTPFASGNQVPDGDGDGTPDSTDGCPSLPGPAARGGCPDACTLTPTITGTNRNDVIQGTPGDDVIFGKDGNDRIFGNGGNDVICAGDGNDTVVTGSGNDLIDTGDGNDDVNAGAGTNAIETGAGNDRVTAGADRDRILTGAGNDTVVAGAGDNTVVTGSGNDVVTTGQGNDHIETGTGEDTIASGGGDDTIDAGAGEDTIDAGTGDDALNGGPGRDVCLPGGGSDTVVNCEAAAIPRDR